jgi:hypothetical protein
LNGGVQVAKMTKTQIRFRLRRMKKDMVFLFLHAPFDVNPADVDAINKVVERLRKRADVKL